MKKTLVRNILIVVAVSAGALSYTFAQTDHTNMDHNAHMKKMAQDAEQATMEASSVEKVMPTEAPEQASMVMTPLKEAGNALFGTIQETIKVLDADPNTDWTKVDLEALRQHLVDMENFSSKVEVVSQTDTDKGTVVVIKPTTEAARASLSRALSAHPGMLKQETGWSMLSNVIGLNYELTIETDKPEEVARLRGLGYIGVMALGNHHQVHHWLMASGNNPHGEHSH